MFRSLVVFSVLLSTSLCTGDELVARTVEDGYLVADGYGGTMAAYLKFDISDLPADAVVDSANVAVYCAQINPSYSAHWGAALFTRIIDQTWDESTPAADLYAAELGKAVRQAQGFKAEPNDKAVSTNDVGLLVADDVGNSFCTIRINQLDPPMGGDLLSTSIENDDTLVIGFSNPAGTQFKFFSSEHQDLPPLLTIYYHTETTAITPPPLSLARPASAEAGSVRKTFDLRGRFVPLTLDAAQSGVAFVPLVRAEVRSDRTQSVLRTRQ